MSTTAKRNEYRIDWRDGVTMTCRGHTPEEAAANACTRRHGRSAFAHRTTGYKGLSGYFQCYKGVSGGGNCSTSVGVPYHVREV